MQQVEIWVKGHIDADWSEWLGGMTISHSDQNVTVLIGPIVDQAALYGLLAKLRDLGLPLVSLSSKEQHRPNLEGSRM